MCVLKTAADVARAEVRHAQSELAHFRQLRANAPADDAPFHKARIANAKQVVRAAQAEHNLAMEVCGGVSVFFLCWKVGIVRYENQEAIGCRLAIRDID
jgi:hypothetical protein